MKKTTTIHAIAVFVALFIVGQALAMGDGMGQGHAGGTHNMGSHMQGGMSGMRNDSSNAGGGQHEDMHQAGSRHGDMKDDSQQHMMNSGMNTDNSKDLQAAPVPVTTQPAGN